MQTHLLIPKTTKELLELRTGFLATLKNPVCAPIQEPVGNTIAQINRELELRGITSLKTQTTLTT